LLSQRLEIPHFDSDDYYWIKTDIPFTQTGEINQRVDLLKNDLQNNPSWVLSGSLCGWGDFVIPMFTLAVSLLIPHELRMSRLVAREIERYGLEAISQGGWFYEHHTEFMEYADKYDSAGTDVDIRNKELHEQWMRNLPCKLLRLEQPLSAQELTTRIEKTLNISP